MNINLSTIGSIHSYMKSLQLTANVEQKKRTGNLMGHEDPTANWMTEELKNRQESDKLASITRKMLAGKKLTAEEKDYLRAKNPQAYQKLMQSEQEQKAYEEELRRCETKEDVQRLKMNRINAALSTIKAAEQGMGKEAAMGIAMEELAKLQAFDRITQEFIKSGDYTKLPTEAERAEAAKDEREAEEAARTQEQEPPAKEQAVKKDASLEAEKVIQAEPVKEAEAYQRNADAETAARQRRVDAGTETRQELGVETAEQKKVRHAKARAVYAAARHTKAPQPVSILDTKA